MYVCINFIQVWPYFNRVHFEKKINSQLLKNLPAKQWASQTFKLAVNKIVFKTARPSTNQSTVSHSVLQ